MTIGLITDSSAQLSPEQAARWATRVVPVTVSLDGVDLAEGVDLTVDDFYRRLADASGDLDLTTSQPTASAFVRAYEAAVAEGVDEILAIVVGSSYSGAINSAELAARSVQARHDGVVVDVVDSGTASFGIACAVWAAADAIAAGGDLAGARAAAIERAASTRSVFVLDGLDLARRSGRFGDVDLAALDAAAAGGVAVLWSGPEGVGVVGHAADQNSALQLMVEFVRAAGRSVVAAVGRAAPELDDISAAFRARLSAEPNVVDVVDYRVGPSIAVHTGPNTVGAFVFPR